MKPLISRKVLVVATLLLVTPPAMRYLYQDVRGLRLSWEVQATRSNDPAVFTLYSTDIVTQGPERDVRQKVTLRSIIAQRSDRARSETRIFYPNTPQTRVDAWDSIGMKTTWNRTAEARDNLRRAAILARPTSESGCTMTPGGPAHPDFRLAGRENVDGIDTFRFVLEKEHMDLWQAPQLDCEEVHMRRALANSGGRITDSTERSTTNFALGEPVNDLFDLSALVEGSPVTVVETQYRKSGFPETFIRDSLQTQQRKESSY